MLEPLFLRVASKPMPKYPTIRHADHGDHPAISVTWQEGAAPEVFCGDSWCRGGCGLPALVMPAVDHCPERKAYGSMTACGPVIQHWRVTWTGSKVHIPAEHRAALVERWWF